MPAVRVLIARFPFGAVDHPDVTDWLVGLVPRMKADPRVGEVLHLRVDDTPITMSRNRACKAALERRCDLVLMIDNDMRPDLPLPGARPFWDSSLDFVLAHAGPCAVAAPYCGPPPHENVYVFDWVKRANDNPNADLKLEQVSREQAAVLAGIREAAALPTGLFLLDTRALAAVPAPWFEYEYEDKEQTRKSTTEDVFFTRNASLAGVPMYCNWDAWAGHWKRKLVTRPELLGVDDVREQFRAGLLRNAPRNERLIDVRKDLRIA